MTALSTESTLRTAPQHGQVTSKAGADLAITASYRKLRLMRFYLDGKHFEQVQHLPSQEKDRKSDNDDGKSFTETETGAAGLEAAGNQSENVKRCEAEHQGPKDGVEVVFLLRILDKHSNGWLQMRAGGAQGTEEGV